MLAWILGSLVAAAGSVPSPEDAVHLQWRIDGDQLLVTARAPGQGWLCVGLNPRDGLAGARLAMAAVHADGRLVVEEHIADPPRHARRTRGRVALGVAGSQSEQGTEVTLRIRRTGRRFTLP